MTYARITLVALLLAGAMAAPAAPATTAQAPPGDPFDSPRLAALARELKSDGPAAVDRFWEEMRGKTPLVEPTADDPHASWVTFLWRGDAATARVNVLGGPTTNDFAAWLTRLGDTDLWYRTDRFIYRFQVNRQHQSLTAERRPAARVYQAVGSFENDWPYSQVAETRRLRDVLLAKGYTVDHDEFSGGHDPVSWRRPFVDGLRTLAPAPR